MLIISKWIHDCIDYGEILIFSREKKAVVTKTIDELFGTEVETTEWIDGFWLGLLPGEDKISINILLGVAPLSAIVIIGTGIVFFINRRRKIRGVS